VTWPEQGISTDAVGVSTDNKATGLELPLRDQWPSETSVNFVSVPPMGAQQFLGTRRPRSRLCQAAMNEVRDRDSSREWAELVGSTEPSS